MIIKKIIKMRNKDFDFNEEEDFSARNVNEDGEP